MENGEKNSRTFKNFQGRVATLQTEATQCPFQSNFVKKNDCIVFLYNPANKQTNNAKNITSQPSPVTHTTYLMVLLLQQSTEKQYKQAGTRGNTICLRPSASWQYLRIYSPGGTCSGMLGYLRHQQQVDLYLLTLKVVSESHVTWATSTPILVLLGLTVLELGPMYATDRDRQTSDKSIV